MPNPLHHKPGRQSSLPAERQLLEDQLEGDDAEAASEEGVDHDVLTPEVDP